VANLLTAKNAAAE